LISFVFIRYLGPLKHQIIHQITVETAHTGLCSTVFRNYQLMVVEPSMEMETYGGKTHAKGTTSL